MHLTLRTALALVGVALTVVPGLKTIAKAQTVGEIPLCAQPALFSAIDASGCQLSQVHCICSDKKIFFSVVQSIQEACDPAQIAAVQALEQTYCGASSSSTSTTESVSAATIRDSTTSTSLTTATKTTTRAPKLTTSTSIFPLQTHPDKSTTYHNTMTYSMATTGTSSMTVVIGGAAETGVSAAALAMVMAGMGWVFVGL